MTKALKLAELQDAYRHHTGAKPRKARTLVTLFLNHETCRVETVVTETKSIDKVYVRDVFEKRVKGKTVAQFGKWREFRQARKASEQPQSLPYVGITAPVEAWDAMGMLDRKVNHDTPKERRKPSPRKDASKKEKAA